MSYFMDKVCIITGGASGIGKGLGEFMAKSGAKVIMTDVNEQALTELVESFRANAYQAVGRTLDVTDAAAVQSVVHDVRQEYGRIDLILNNAGIGILGTCLDFSLEDWDKLIDINVKGVIYGTQAVYPIMREQGFGQIVNTASLAGLLPVVGSVPYAMTKHAVVGLSKSLRAEAAPFGVKVNALCPSFVKTNIIRASRAVNFKPESSEQLINRTGGFIPLEQFVPEAIAGIEKNRGLIVLPRSARSFWRFYRFLPERFMDISARVAKKVDRMRVDADFHKKNHTGEKASEKFAGVKG